MAMEAITNPTDTFSPAFSSSHFARPDDLPPVSDAPPASSALQSPTARSDPTLQLPTSPTGAPPAPINGPPAASAGANGPIAKPQSTVPTATTAPAAAAGGALPPNPRSCVTCRRRKVKCDKRRPCGNCAKAQVECIFPKPGRAPRKPRKPQDAELLARLRRLEGVVQKLGTGASGAGASEGALAAALREVGAGAGGAVSDTEAARRGSEGRWTASADEGERKKSKSGSPAVVHGQIKVDNKRDTGDKIGGKDFPKTAAELEERCSRANKSKLEQEMGKLVVGDGRSRYVSNTFWAGLTDEIAEMRDLLDYTSDEDEDEPYDYSSPESQGLATSQMTSPAPVDGGLGIKGRVTHQEFLFGYSSSMTTLRTLHPASSQIPTYWEVYIEAIDPLVRILHKPTTARVMSQAARDPGSLTKGAETLVFAIYMAAATALAPELCQERLGLDKETGMKRYRYATEQALARAGFLTSQELVVLQALILYLICVRRQEGTKMVWSLSGLALRIAQSMGLHRDGTKFRLTPFDTEMRRRIWWQVCILDLRASEDQGTEPMVSERLFDTQFPLNVNDADLWPDMTEPPQPREGFTEMTFDMVRYELSRTVRTLSSMQRFKKAETADGLRMQDEVLERLETRLYDKYLRHCDPNDPLQWVAKNVATLIICKMWLVIHHPFRHRPGIDGSDVRGQTFAKSLEIIRLSRLVENGAPSKLWGWLFRSYFQWHAMAFVLAELCRRGGVGGEEVDDAWAVVDDAWPHWQRHSPAKSSPLWKPIRRLYARAGALRTREREKLRAFPTNGTLGPAPTSAPAPAGSERTAAPSARSGAETFGTVSNLPPGLSNVTTPSPRSTDTLDAPPFSSDVPGSAPFLSNQPKGTYTGFPPPPTNVQSDAATVHAGFMPLSVAAPPSQAELDNMDLSQFLADGDAGGGSGGLLSAGLGGGGGLFQPPLGDFGTAGFADPLFPPDADMGGIGFDLGPTTGGSGSSSGGPVDWAAWEQDPTLREAAREPVTFSIWGG